MYVSLVALIILTFTVTNADNNFIEWVDLPWYIIVAKALAIVQIVLMVRFPSPTPAATPTSPRRSCIVVAKALAIIIVAMIQLARPPAPPSPLFQGLHPRSQGYWLVPMDVMLMTLASKTSLCKATLPPQPNMLETRSIVFRRLWHSFHLACRSACLTPMFAMCVQALLMLAYYLYDFQMWKTGTVDARCNPNLSPFS